MAAADGTEAATVTAQKAGNAGAETTGSPLKRTATLVGCALRRYPIFARHSMAVIGVKHQTPHPQTWHHYKAISSRIFPSGMGPNSVTEKCSGSCSEHRYQVVCLVHSGKMLPRAYDIFPESLSDLLDQLPRVEP